MNLTSYNESRDNQADTAAYALERYKTARLATATVITALWESGRNANRLFTLIGELLECIELEVFGSLPGCGTESIAETIGTIQGWVKDGAYESMLEALDDHFHLHIAQAKDMAG